MSNDENKKTAEEMSLEELLGHQGGAPTDDYDDLDEDQKRNEAGSGLINLAAMVGSGMLENNTAAAPTNAFDAAKAANVASGKEEAAPAQAAPQPRASSHQMDAAVQQQPVKKFPLGIIIGIAAAVIIAGVVSVLIFSSDGDAEKNKAKALAQMNADLAAMIEKSQNAVGEEKEAIDAEIAKKQAGIAAVETADAEDIEEAMDFGDEEPEEEDVEGMEMEMEIEEDETGAKTGRTRRTRTASRSTASTVSKAAAEPEVKAEETKKSLTASLTSTAPKKTIQKKNSAPVPTEKAKKTDALSSLLTSSATKSDGGLPEIPSKAQVSKAMGRVIAKAKGMCGKQGGGKVTVRVTVGSNGRVRDALPIGAHSSSTLGRCVSTIVRKTGNFPKFKKPTITFNYPISI